MLEEAAWAFSGIVYGFEYSYTPYDKTRGIEERFEIASLGAIAPHSLTLVGGSRVRSDYETRSYVEYRPDLSQAELMGTYLREPWKGSQGVGRADILRGVGGRAEAYRDALRAAVRSFLQGLEPNKPRLAKGRVAFERPPSLSLVDGYYVVQARVRVMSLEVLPYAAY